MGCCHLPCNYGKTSSLVLDIITIILFIITEGGPGPQQ